MQFRQVIEERLFQKIHLGNLVYNTCWEDPRCDRAMLDLKTDSNVVMLTSAGCNALDYLLDSPASVHCVDMNPRQNALLHFKMALLQGTDHQTLFNFFGQGVAQNRREVYFDTVEDRLPEDYSAKYWQRKLHYFSGQGIRRSFYWHGSSGMVAWTIRQWLHTQPKMLRLARGVFESTTLEEQTERFSRFEPYFLNGFVKWAVRQHLVQSLLGVPRSQQDMAAAYFEDGLFGYLRHCLRHVFTQLTLQDNYFWKLYFFGQYTADCCPNYLKPENFDTLKKNTQHLTTHTQSLSDFLVQNPGTYSHFVLLDHQDWLAAHLKPELEREWKLILENSQPGTKILMRSAAFEPDFIPPFVLDRIRFDPGAAAESQANDRVGTYAGTWFATVTN